MKRIITLTAMSIVGLMLIGCGGGGGDSSSTTAPVSATATDVTVERGKVFDANVTDANGAIGVDKNGTNVYTFASQPIYPISVKGGWIDVDGDSRKTPADVELTLELKSYSNIITPLTTYIADANETIRNSKLSALSQKFGLTVDELKTLPSVGSKNALLLQNAIYEHLKLNETNFANINLDSVKTSYDSLGVIASNNPDMNQSELTKLIEKGVIKNLITQSKEKAITLAASDFTSAEKQIYVNPTFGDILNPTNEANLSKYQMDYAVLTEATNLSKIDHSLYTLFPKEWDNEISFPYYEAKITANFIQNAANVNPKIFKVYLQEGATYTFQSDSYGLNIYDNRGIALVSNSKTNDGARVIISGYVASRTGDYYINVETWDGSFTSGKIVSLKIYEDIDTIISH